MSRFARWRPEETHICPRSTDLPLDPIETASHDTVQTLQLEHLKRSLAHAYESVPVYRARFDATGVHPSDLRSLTDLARFPFTTKTDLRDNYPFGASAVPQDRVARIHTSSGTAGEPTIVDYTLADIDTWAGLVARSIRAAGTRCGDKVHVSYGYGLFTGGLGAHYGVKHVGPTAIPFGGGWAERQAQLTSDSQPQIIMVTPSYMLAIADEFERQRVDPAASSLWIGIFGAEPWAPGMRSATEARMRLSAVNIYDLSEMMRPGVTSECTETKDDPTIWEDHFYPEIIDPETSEVLLNGKFGELAFALLTKEAIPVMCYRTRDLTRLLPGTARPGLRRMEKITGHCGDMMIVRGVNVFPSQIGELILKHATLSSHYQCVPGKGGPLDTLTVRIEAALGVPADAAQSANSQLAHKIKSLIGVTAAIETFASGEIERSVGKARRVVDLQRG